MSEINFFAKTNFRNQDTVFGIKKEDRTRHMYVIGKTGVGKSNVLENMAIQDIRNGEGVCFVDPHGEGAEKLLKSIPANRINDVVYFNPADMEYPIAFNILEAVSEDRKNLVASGMMGVFKKIWPDVWSARMEYILNNTILALLDFPGSTMLGANRMMFDKDYRKRVYLKIKDPVVKSFWINEFDKWEDRFRKEAVAAIQNKVGQFLSSSTIRNIVGQPKSTIDMSEIMNRQKILIVNLSKGRIGEDAMRLLGGMIVTKIQLAAMGRVEVPEAERKDFYLYVDEFQNFATESFANILSEARKYRLNLILAHQYINQLIFDNNTTVRDAVFGNIGTLVSFRVGAEDAEHLEKEFEPVFMMNDLVNLAKYNVYIKLMIDGITGDAFSATTLPPFDLSETEMNEEKVIRISRERYGRNRAEVEEKITRWSGMLPEEDVKVVKLEEQEKISAEKKETKEADKETLIISKPKTIKEKTIAEPEKKKEERVMYEAICDTCEEKVLVPFKPDPGRPAFCKDCLKDYQRAMARTRAEVKEGEEIKIKKVFPRKKIDVPEDKIVLPNNNDSSNVVAHVSTERPMSLSQMAHIAPKKFKNQRKKPEIDLGSVRQLIDRTKEN
ncbi:MAG: type IV secretion system DNA-binding domain-containing protein [Candidatus Moranbacteria bacterium]|nr:type IV secretion system DNA-binding domain-containing protein [Candidatus Moranbacteria bacterium]